MVKVPVPEFPTKILPLVTTPFPLTLNAPMPEYPTKRVLAVVHVPLETVAVPLELAP